MPTAIAGKTKRSWPTTPGKPLRVTRQAAGTPRAVAGAFNDAVSQMRVLTESQTQLFEFEDNCH